ncbi:MAG: putative surface protein with fasciclin (FAS1) repeats [Ulvibacter sp.]|jgi:uncharacterized surface protein with fasciclin (FAS1) repeats
MRFKNLFFIAFCFIITSASAQKYSSGSTSVAKSTWEGISFSSEKTIQENINEAPKLSIVAKVASEDELVAAIAKEEMVTIFVPVDIAFTDLPKKERELLLSNTSRLSSMMKFLTIPGRVDLNSMITAIEKNDGKAYFTTLSGETIGVKMLDGRVVLFDSEKNIATITASNFYHKNGFFHIINGLLYPSAEAK